MKEDNHENGGFYSHDDVDRAHYQACRPSMWFNGDEYPWSNKFNDYVRWIPVGNGRVVPRTYQQACDAWNKSQREAEQALMQIYADLQVRNKTSGARKDTPKDEPVPLKTQPPTSLPVCPIHIPGVTDDEPTRDVDLSYNSELNEKALREIGQEIKRKFDLEDLVGNERFHDLRLDGKTVRQAIRDSKTGERFRRNELEENLRKRESSEMLDGFVPQKNVKLAAKFIKDVLDIDADYGKIPIEVANDVNQELIRARNMFGTIGIIETIRPDQAVVARGAFASYNPGKRAFLLRPKFGRMAATTYFLNAPEGRFSTKSPLHGYRHEIGHALHYYCEQILYPNDRLRLSHGLKNLYDEYFTLSHKGITELSVYARTDVREMVAESFAQIINNTPSSLAKQVLLILKGANYDF